MKKNILAILLAFLMTLSLLPMNASAAENAAEQSEPAVSAEANESGENKDAAAAGAFKTTLVGVRYSFFGNDKGSFAYMSGCKLWNVPCVCQKCLKGEHSGNHSVKISDLKGPLAAKEKELFQGSDLIIGVMNEFPHEGKLSIVHCFDEEGEIETADNGWLYFVVTTFYGQIGVQCESDPTHEKKSYHVTGDSIASAVTSKNAEGIFTCQLTVKKSAYIDRYDQETGCTHTDTNAEEETATFDFTYNSGTGRWVAPNAVISVKCAPDPVTFDLDNADGAGTHVFNKTLTGNYPENFAEEFKVTVTPDEDAASTMAGGSLTGTASVSASSGYEKVPFRFAETGEGEERAAASQGQLTFSEEGAYRYTVQETAGTTSYMSYDSKSYTLTVTVGKDGSALAVTGWQIDEQENTPLTITNTYSYVPYVPYVPVIPTPTPAPSKPALNTDDHYAYIVGYPDGTVRPNSQITRAEATTIFFRLLTDASREQYWSTSNTYSDVSAGDWYNNAISTMTRAGIVNGYPDGTFRPNAPITRAEMSKIIALFAKLDRSENRFSDIAGHWAEGYIKLAAGNGWIEGYPDGTFGPQRNITRAETVTMINRVLERVPANESRLLSAREMQTYPDCRSGQWYYIAMQEATNSHTYQRAVTEKNGDEQWTALRTNRDWKLLEK